MTIEEVKALYFDTDALREPSRKLKRIDGGDLRWYYSIENDKIIWFVSVTSLIKSTMPTSEFLIKWIAERGYEKATAERDEKAGYGTALHIACGQYLIGKFSLEYLNCKEFLESNKVSSSYTRELQKDILSFAQFCKDYDVQPLAIEVMISDTELGIAGCCDLVCKMTYKKHRIIAIIDMKSGKKGFYESHEIQLLAYKRLFENTFPDVKIDMMFNWSPKDWQKEPTYNLTDQTGKHSYRKLDILAELFKMSNPVKPSPRFEFNGEISLNGTIGNNFKVISFEDYIRDNDEYFKSYIELPKSTPTPGRIVRQAAFEEILTDDGVDNDNPFPDLRPAPKPDTAKIMLDNTLDF